MASALVRDVSVDEIERRLEELREEEEPSQRTSVLTHMAWVPAEWSEAADRVMVGLGPRVPSRTLLLHPDPAARVDRIDARIDHECFPGGGHDICAEVVNLWLRGGTAKAPATVVVPLQIPDLPVFLRWRGRPPFGGQELEQLVGVSDRLIVDSTEWRGLPSRVRAPRRAVRTHRRLRPRLGPHAPLAGGPGGSVAGDQDWAHARSRRPARRGAPPARLAAVAAAAATSG